MKDKFVYIATALECIDLIKDYTTANLEPHTMIWDTVQLHLTDLQQALKSL